MVDSILSAQLSNKLFNDNLNKTKIEEVRAGLFLTVHKFITDNFKNEFKFINSLTSKERAFVHLIARLLNLHSTSKRDGDDRSLTIQKLMTNISVQFLSDFLLSSDNRSIIIQLLQSNPINSREKFDFYLYLDNTSSLDKCNREQHQKGTTGKLMGAIPQIPSSSIVWTRNFPICAYRLQIIEHIKTNSITIIAGSPGIGKTTCIPQFILEDCIARGQKCRVISTQPRRLLAHIKAERLATLCGESVGQTIGYQIRLESKVSPRTLLTFCTHNVLLRTIYADLRIMLGTTHIIVDEMDEDEVAPPLPPASSSVSTANCCYSTNCSHGHGMLASLVPSLLAKFPHLKIILVVSTRPCRPKDNSLQIDWNLPAPCRAESMQVNRLKLSSDLEYNLQAMLNKSHLATLTSPVSPHFTKPTSTKSSAISSVIGQTRPTSTHVVDILNLNSPTESPNASCMSNEPVQHFQNYFSGASLINIPHMPKSVKTLYLEDILQWNQCATSMQTEQVSKLISQDIFRCQVISNWFRGIPSTCSSFIEESVNNNNSNIYRDSVHRQHFTEFETNQFSKCGWDESAWSLSHNDSIVDNLHNLNLDMSKCSNTTDKSIPLLYRKHADHLLWTIWNNAVVKSKHRFVSTTHHDGELNDSDDCNDDSDDNADDDDDVLDIGRNGNDLKTKHSAVIDSNATWTSGVANVDNLDSCHQRGQLVQNSLTNLLQCILAGWIPVDYEHTYSGMTSLHVCAAAGLLNAIVYLINLGANIFVRIPVGYNRFTSYLTASDRSGPSWTWHGPKHRSLLIDDGEIDTVVGANAFDLAKLFGHHHVADTIRIHVICQNFRHALEDFEYVLVRFGSWFPSPTGQVTPFDCLPPTSLNSSTLNSPLLMAYHQERFKANVPETCVDLNLIASLLVKLHQSMNTGSILVFMPSYEEIILLREKLFDPEIKWWSSDQKPFVFILHFRMLVADLKTIYLEMPYANRKIILSTNIGESFISFDDVLYVVDCGLDCAKSYVPSAHITALRNNWILQSNALQRQSRVSSDQHGICFRMYSSIRFESFGVQCNTYLRGHSVEEVCIQARLFSPPMLPIQVALQTLPKPPMPAASQQAIQTLKELDVLDQSEELTKLGCHVCDMPIPAQYVKMVLASVVLKCLDPILTIACILTYNEPFTLACTTFERKEMSNLRRRFSADTFSDHMILLRAFQFWQKARSEGWEKSFCQKNFISAAAFESITAIRTQLLGQLRASGFVKARGACDIRDLNSNSENWAVVKAVIVAGMPTAHLAKMDSNGDEMKFKLTYDDGTEWASLCHQSVLDQTMDGPKANFPSKWIVYDQLISIESVQTDSEPKSDNRLIKCATVVTPLTILLMSGPVHLMPEIINVDPDHSVAQSKTPTHSTNCSLKEMPHHNDNFRTHSNASTLESNIRLPQFTTSTHNNDKDTVELHGDDDDDDEEVTDALECNDDDDDADDNGDDDDFNDNDSVKHLNLLFRTPPLDMLANSQLDELRCQIVNQSSANNDANNQHVVCLLMQGMKFCLESVDARLVVGLRHKWHSLFVRRLKNPGKQSMLQDEATLTTIITTLTAQEQSFGLRQPSGVGSRPRPMATELCNQMTTSVPNRSQTTAAASMRSYSNETYLIPNSGQCDVNYFLNSKQSQNIIANWNLSNVQSASNMVTRLGQYNLNQTPTIVSQNPPFIHQSTSNDGVPTRHDLSSHSNKLWSGVGITPTDHQNNWTNFGWDQ